MMHLYSAGRSRPLAARLAEVWAAPPADPFAPEWLAVPSDGMRRWLSLELARHLGASGSGGDGVVANVIRAYPGTLRSAVLTAARGEDSPDPWVIDRLVWAVLAALDGGADDPALAALSALPPGASRYARSRRIADLYDRYHLHRPAMIRSWVSGRDVDPLGAPLAAHDAWQPRLWRRVRRDVGEPSPPERWPGLLDEVVGNHLALDLPPRLTLFGFSLLPGGGFLDLARAVAEHREVHLFLLEPSISASSGFRRPGSPPFRNGGRLRPEETVGDDTAHPLLRSWGRPQRETALILSRAEAEGMPLRQRVDREDGTAPVSLLGRLQRHMRSDGGRSEAVGFDPTDRSVQFHACFGPTRQVEVLRDALLHLLSEGAPDLAEEDLLVVCPSLERFAPVIEAVFGPSVEPTLGPESEMRTARGAPGLRYRITDRSIRSTNSCLSAVAALVDLVSGRFESSAVLDFLALGPVRARFEFGDDDLDDIAGWVAGTNVRWGIDPAHREAFGVPATIDGNTWQAALDRLLLGAAVDDDGLTLAVGDVAPYGIEGQAPDTVGRLSEAMGCLGALAEQTRSAKPIDRWIDEFRRASNALFSFDSRNQWQEEVLSRLFDDVIQSAIASNGPSPIVLEFVDFRHLFAARLESITGRPDYFRGGITVSSMTPLRGVPFRVVCLLGMDQSAFGPVSAPGDDLMAAAPEVGDPDPRADMRQSLLEAVLAAEDCLVIVRDGRDIRTNQVVPRPVVVAELFEAVTQLVEAEDRVALAEQLELDHPRQPFDEKCFETDALRPGVVWGFDGGELAGARARRNRAPVRPPFLAEPLAPVDKAVVELDQLHAFFRNPAAYFIAQRLEAHLPVRAEEPSELLPVELDPLSRWQVATRLLEARLAGIETDGWRAVEGRRGTLPPGSLGDRMVEACRGDVEAVVAAAAAIGVDSRPTNPIEIEVTLSSGVRVLGSVPLGLTDPNPGRASVSYSKLKPEHRVHAWLDLVALVATEPHRRWRSVAVGRPGTAGAQADIFDVGIAGEASRWADVASEALEVAVDCYLRGLREPLPFFPGFSYAVHTEQATAATWSNGRSFPEGDDPAVVLAFGRIGFDEVLGLPPRPGDPGDAGDAAGRVLRFARYLYGTVDRSTRPWSDVAELSAAGPLAVAP